MADTGTSGLAARQLDALLLDFQKSVAEYPNIQTGADFEGYASS